MKKIILLFTALTLLTISSNAAMKYSEALSMNGTKPMAVLIYSSAADNYQTSQAQFKRIQNELGTLYNYVELDIASKDALEYTEQFNILTKLPYIMLYRNNGKFSRVINRDCIPSTSCAVPKMKSFIKL